MIERESEECTRPSTSSVSRFPSTYCTWLRCNQEPHIGNKNSSWVRRMNGKNDWACRSSNTFPIWPSRAGRRKDWRWSSSTKKLPSDASAERRTLRMPFWLPIPYPPRVVDRETDPVGFGSMGRMILRRVASGTLTVTRSNILSITVANIAILSSGP
jgi:hypothetical protein